MRGPRGLGARIARSRSGEHRLPACVFESLAVASRPLQRQLAEKRGVAGIRATKQSLFRELSPWEKDSAAKFAIARTRSPAREPRALPRTCSAAVVFFKTGPIETHEQKNACCPSPASSRAI